MKRVQWGLRWKCSSYGARLVEVTVTMVSMLMEEKKKTKRESRGSHTFWTE